jgi:23S rRNA pseudouridine1911/1915/1917 synthase
MTLTILYEDKDVIVCVKPAGVPTQSSQIQTPDMVSILTNHLSEQSASHKQPYLAVIHRLDQPVEGILVFAKTPYAAKELNRQLTTHGFGKYYRALLRGKPAATSGTLIHYLVKDGKTNSSKVCKEGTPGAKLASLDYEILHLYTCKDGSEFAVAEIKLYTGRHHQIRVQMSQLGLPIVGDRKYDPAATIPTELSSQLPHQLLQLYACKLSFQHPRTCNQMEFSIQRLDHFDKES